MCPVRLVPLSDIEKKYQQTRQSKVTGLAEYTEALEKLIAGDVKPDKALVLELSAEAQKNMGANPRATLKRHLKRAMTKRGISGYTIRGVKEANNVQVLIITNVGAGKEKPSGKPKAKR